MLTSVGLHHQYQNSCLAFVWNCLEDNVLNVFSWSLPLPLSGFFFLVFITMLLRWLNRLLLFLTSGQDFGIFPVQRESTKAIIISSLPLPYPSPGLFCYTILRPNLCLHFRSGVFLISSPPDNSVHSNIWSQIFHQILWMLFHLQSHLLFITAN